ncbi:MAG: hypothetical protein HY074_05110 [Deltaproteobacteria bacterium]|nr:hypothetical protein [Deltaproteobacteria bacterium]
MPIALTRDVPPEINNCELTFIARKPIDVTLARTQHAAYQQALARHGVQVVALPCPDQMPDGVFVEDPAVILDEVAIMTRMGTPARHSEVQSFSQVVARYRPLAFRAAPIKAEWSS